MVDKAKIEERRKEFAEELHAGSVFRDIQARLKERPKYEKRWFWELLQNAKDAIEKQSTIDIKLIINEDKIEFSHSGDPFALDDILSLIIQGSTKSDKEDKTGRFGTGFMTTYLLSRKVRLIGEISETDGGGFFNFILNRQTDDLKEFYEFQKKANQDFIESIKPEGEESVYKTKFIYYLDETGKKTAQKGLESINDLISFTQIFNTKIKSIVIEKNGSIFKYSQKLEDDNFYSTELTESSIYNDSVSKPKGKIEVWKLITEENDEVIKKWKAYLLKTDFYESCFVTSIFDNTEYIVPIDKKYPKLFYTFPLIGTEEIGIPFVINSEKFDPKVERNGIYLKNNESEEESAIKLNKEILKIALIDSVNVFMNFSFLYSIELKRQLLNNIYNLFNFSESKDYDWIDTEWLKDLKHEIFTLLFDKSCIQIANELYPVSKLTFPYSKDSELIEDIYILLNQLSDFKMIGNSELDSWLNILKIYATQFEDNIYDLDNIWGVKKIIKYIANVIKNLETLELKLNHNSPSDWLNSFYRLIFKDLEVFPLDKSILLNQEGIFRVAENMLWDKSKDEVLTSISVILGTNFKKKLIANIITPIEINGVREFKTEQAISEIKIELNTLSEIEYQKDENRRANALFLKWLIENSNFEIISDLKILLGNEQKGSFVKSKHLLLSPKEFWWNEFPLYSEITRDNDCMHEIYNQILEKVHFEKLAQIGLIHYSPLVTRTEKIDSRTLEALICNTNDLEKVKDDEGKLNIDIELTYNDFAYLTASENHIYDRNSSTTFTRKLFKFLINEATEKDPYFNAHTEKKQINGSTIKLEQSLWLKRAKNNSWVNVKVINPEGESKFSKEKPSSRNLSEVIKNDDELIKTIKGEKQIQFLTKIDVGVSDLIRNTLPNDEVRYTWDKVLTNMITSDIDPDLANEIMSDPNIQDVYEKKKNARKLIDRNQKIGYRVEELFTQLIEQLKQEGVNVSIKREPWGSDYILKFRT